MGWKVTNSDYPLFNTNSTANNDIKDYKIKTFYDKVMVVHLKYLLTIWHVPMCYTTKKKIQKLYFCH